MGLALRDGDRHTYADYLTWGEEARYELTDGAAYLMAPAPLLEHQDTVGEIFRQLANALAGTRCRVYERAGVREYWLVHPVDRVVTIYRLIDGQFGRPDVFELTGATPVGVLPGVAIAWDELAQRLPKPEA
jgi:Uma2 family endonuclease